MSAFSTPDQTLAEEWRTRNQLGAECEPLKLGLVSQANYPMSKMVCLDPGNCGCKEEM